MNKFFSLMLLYYILGMSCALFFTGFGIHVLLLSYAMEHPGYFIIFFFTASFIILLSATLFIALGFRLYHHIRPPVEKELPDDSEDG